MPRTSLPRPQRSRPRLEAVATALVLATVALLLAVSDAGAGGGDGRAAERRRVAERRRPGRHVRPGAARAGGLQRSELDRRVRRTAHQDGSASTPSATGSASTGRRCTPSTRRRWRGRSGPATRSPTTSPCAATRLNCATATSACSRTRKRRRPPSTRPPRGVDGGFGLVPARLENGHVVAVWVQPGGPAARAGLKLGARLLRWRGRPIDAALARVGTALSPTATPPTRAWTASACGSSSAPASARSAPSRSATAGPPPPAPRASPRSPTTASRLAKTDERSTLVTDGWPERVVAPHEILPGNVGYVRVRFELDLPAELPGDHTPTLQEFRRGRARVRAGGRERRGRRRAPQLRRVGQDGGRHDGVVLRRALLLRVRGLVRHRDRRVGDLGPATSGPASLSRRTSASGSSRARSGTTARWSPSWTTPASARARAWPWASGGW